MRMGRYGVAVEQPGGRMGGMSMKGM